MIIFILFLQKDVEESVKKCFTSFKNRLEVDVE